MNYKKNLIAGAVAAALVPAAARAEIELGSGLSVTGFLDMSTFFVEPDVSDSFRTSGIDQFEIDFMWEGSNGVSAQVDIEYGESSAGGPGDDDTFVEQAFVTKSFNDKLSLKFGRFLSYTGWETQEPTGLFQYSTVGYEPFFYGYYQQGASMYYDAGTVDFMASVVTSAFDPLDRSSDLDAEIGVAISPGEGAFTAKLFYIDDDDNDYTDVWASYKVGNVTLAAELVQRDLGLAGEGDGYLLMANFAKDNFAFTVRYGDYTLETAGGVSFLENTSITLSPSFKVGDHLLIVTEYRMDEFDVGGEDTDSLAVEALFMF
jgi:hypothetical protein